MDQKELTTKRSLYCDLTDEEFVDRATELADVDEEIAKLDGEKKRVTKEFTDKIGGRVSRKLELRRIVQTKEEEREIECKWFKDFPVQELRLVRLDTNEVIDSRTMTAAELQGELPLDGHEGEHTDTDDGDLAGDEDPGDGPVDFTGDDPDDESGLDDIDTGE